MFNLVEFLGRTFWTFQKRAGFVTVSAFQKYLRVAIFPPNIKKQRMSENQTLLSLPGWTFLICQTKMMTRSRKKACLSEQIMQTLNAAGGCCAFITIGVARLFLRYVLWRGADRKSSPHSVFFFNLFSGNNFTMDICCTSVIILVSNVLAIYAFYFSFLCLEATGAMSLFTLLVLIVIA